MKRLHEIDSTELGWELANRANDEIDEMEMLRDGDPEDYHEAKSRHEMYSSMAAPMMLIEDSPFSVESVHKHLEFRRSVAEAWELRTRLDASLHEYVRALHSSELGPEDPLLQQRAAAIQNVRDGVYDRPDDHPNIQGRRNNHPVVWMRIGLEASGVPESWDTIAQRRNSSVVVVKTRYDLGLSSLLRYSAIREAFLGDVGSSEANVME